MKKMSPDDPKLTAFALDELDEPEKSAIARALANSPEAQRFVADAQQLARALRLEYGAARKAEPIVRTKIIGIYDEPFWSKVGPFAIAAALALLAVIGAIAFGTNRSGSVLFLPSSSSRAAASGRPDLNQFAVIEGEEPAASRNPSQETDTGPYAYASERPFVTVSSNPRSSFPIIVTPASYLNLQRSINGGVLPPRDAVRIEQMINYFHYDYPQPAQGEPFSINVDVATCPWEPLHRLIRIGLKGREANIIEGDTTIDVEFNPGRVALYRLIGYDRQPPRKQNVNERVGSVRIDAGYTVTALFEAVLVAKQSATVHTQTPSVTSQAAERLLSTKLRFRAPGNDKTQFIERAVTDGGVAFAEAPPDLKFAAAVAEFGMILRDSEYKGNGTLVAVLEWAQEGQGADATGDRAGFIELVRKAQVLKRG